MKMYAMSDLHGYLYEFEEALSNVDLSGDNMLILLGDYVHGPDSYGVIERIIELQRQYGQDKVVALRGNHEDMVIDGRWPISATVGGGFDERGVEDDKYIQWMNQLALGHVSGKTIFCHAGVEEEAEDEWEWGTDDYTFIEKFPAQTGKFCMDIVAGHVGTSSISGDEHYHDIYFDGESHYYIDGSVQQSGVIPVLMLDTDNGKYYRVTETGASLILPYDEEN